MSDDKLFGEGLPGTGGDFIDVTDVEGHMSNKKIDPMPPTATGGPRGNIPTVVGSDEDTEGHRRAGGGHLPTNAPEPDGLGSGRNPNLPSVDGEDVEGHRRAGGGHLPTNAPEPDGLGSGRGPRIPTLDGDDVEGHRRAGGGHLPTNAPEDAGPSQGVGKSTGSPFPPGYSDENDVEGHMGGLTQRRPTIAPEGDGFVKRGPDEMPHGDR